MIPRTLEEILVDILHRTEELERKSEMRRLKGKISDVDAKKGLVRVEIDKDDQGQPVKTPWIPWAEIRCGNIKSYFIPSKGEQVEVVCENGDLTDAYVGMSLPSDANPRCNDKEDEAKVDVKGKTSVTYREGDTQHDTPHSKVNSGKIEFKRSSTGPGKKRKGVPLGGVPMS